LSGTALLLIKVILHVNHARLRVIESVLLLHPLHSGAFKPPPVGRTRAPLQRSAAGVERAEQSGGLHKRSAEAWGNSLRARGAEPFRFLSLLLTFNRQLDVFVTMNAARPRPAEKSGQEFSEGLHELFERMAALSEPRSGESSCRKQKFHQIRWSTRIGDEVGRVYGFVYAPVCWPAFSVSVWR
jgi:hypothetical protein